MITPNPSRPVEASSPADSHGTGAPTSEAVTPPFGPVPPIHIGRPPRTAAPAHRVSRDARAVVGRGLQLLRRLHGWLTRST